MLVHLLFPLSALSLGLSYVSCTTPQQQSQLATLHERMNQMINALYSSPLFSKVKATTSSEETSTPQQESYTYSAAPPPQVVYLSPPLEAGPQPNDYGYPVTSHPVPKEVLSYPYDYSHQPQYAPLIYSPPLPRPYSEYARTSYPQMPSSPALPPPFPATTSYGPFSSTQYPMSFSLPYHPAYPASSLPPYPSPLAPITYPPPYFPSLPYPPAVPAPYPSPLPQQYAPSFLSRSYPSPPAPFRSINSGPYSPPLSYPTLFQHLPTPAFPKPSDILPQPQYEYN